MSERDPDLEWLDHVRPEGLVIAPRLIRELGLAPRPQTALDNALVQEIIADDPGRPALGDGWAFVREVLGWEARHVAGAPGGPPLPGELDLHLAEHGVTLSPTWAVAELSETPPAWQLLARVEAPGVDPDGRHALEGWEATPHQRFERLLRERGVLAGVLISERAETRDGETTYHPELRLICAPRGETSGYLVFPLRPMRDVAGRPMLGGLKLMLGAFRLFSDAPDRRLTALLRRSREAQAAVSNELAGQVLGALHELLRGLDAAEPAMVRDLARDDPGELYDGLLAVLMRLVFILYAEDRGLLPTLAEGRTLYECGYSVRGLHARLLADDAHNPDTMDERVGGWGRLIALFRLIHGGHGSGFIQARGGKLFDPNAHPFLEGRAGLADEPRILELSDGCLLRVLEGLMTLKGRGGARERLSYRTLDVEQIGSVYETVMGFEARLAAGASLAIKAGKNNRTPVFVDLDALLALTGVARGKAVAEAGRTLTAAQARPVQAAATVEALAAALASIVDERGSPGQRASPAGTPILQPTDERRRTGSHYTPRSLTEPIVRHALAPAFARLGPDATADEVLGLKVCDPAMGSGAFLVEACRVLAERLVAAWARWPKSRPPIPAGEDEALLARRLVALSSLYGVDKNPRAVDLARLSLWLATLAGGHEFTFLDHALKCGDSLVGLDVTQLAATHWDGGQPPSFVGQMMGQHIAAAEAERQKVRSQAEWASEAELRPLLRGAEARLDLVRAIGDAVIGAFFSQPKPRKRVEVLVDLQQRLLGAQPAAAAAPFAASLRQGEHPIPPFHWALEFPEVFSRDNPGFDAIVGNPPFAGKNTLIEANRAAYLPWLQTLHAGAHGNADLVAHFFRRAFGLLRAGGVFGLIATNTIGQGDTRGAGLEAILADGGTILRATRRHKWLGEAAVVVSIVHVMKGAGEREGNSLPPLHGEGQIAKRSGWGALTTGEVSQASTLPTLAASPPVPPHEGEGGMSSFAPVLDGRPARRISAYLVEGDLDSSPAPLAANMGKAFQGSIVLGMGFTFDDDAAAKGAASSLADMRALIAKDPRNAQRIFPYIGGEEVNTSPTHAHHRYVIDFGEMSEAEARAGWPDLMAIVEEKVKSDRQRPQNLRYDRMYFEWWKYWCARPQLHAAIARLGRVLVLSRVSPQMAIASLPARAVFADSCVIFPFSTLAPFAVLQSRAHELWARFFSSTLEERLRYAPSDCFRTFPFPRAFETSAALEAAGETYHAHRATVMVARGEGLTKTYNRFHDRACRDADIETLRALHAAMDRAVLAAYGWDDLAERAAPAFIEPDEAPGKTRLDWPAPFKDDVLARLLALNATRPHAQTGGGHWAEREEGDGEDA